MGVCRSVIELDSELGPKLGRKYEGGGWVRHEGVGPRMPRARRTEAVTDSSADRRMTAYWSVLTPIGV
jgi:hypothetical protein